jgi:hypothetical protein
MNMKLHATIYLGIILVLVIGCKLLPEEPAQIIQKTDMYYEIIKIIVTDPEVKVLLTPEQLADMHEIEQAYKAIRKMAVSIEKSQAIVRTMAQCGLDICDILDQLDVEDEKRKEIAALRIGLKVFMATLVEPPVEPEVLE